MTVYVDDVRHPFGRMIMCHMWADSRDELIAMAEAIGVDRKWLQRPPKASWTHFDISLGKKAEAIRCGAVLTDRYGPSEHIAGINLANPDPSIAAHARTKLDQIAAIRAQRTT